MPQTLRLALCRRTATAPASPASRHKSLLSVQCRNVSTMRSSLNIHFCLSPYQPRYCIQRVQGIVARAVLARSAVSEQRLSTVIHSTVRCTVRTQCQENVDRLLYSYRINKLAGFWSALCSKSSSVRGSPVTEALLSLGQILRCSVAGQTQHWTFPKLHSYSW